MVEKMAAVLEEKVPGNSAEFTQPIEMRFNEMIAGSKSEFAIKIFGNDITQSLQQWQLYRKNFKRILTLCFNRT
jgi:cobalt-zinc-cadmium resistance protein CzcA